MTRSINYITLIALLLTGCGTEPKPIIEQNTTKVIKKTIKPKVVLPKNYYVYKDEIISEVTSLNLPITDINQIDYFLGLIEHESCISLKSKRCFSPKSELLTKWKRANCTREQGVGFGQITRAWNRSCRIRLDVLKEVHRYKDDRLQLLTWDNIKNEPGLQARAIASLWYRNYRAINKNVPSIERVMFADSAYNGGYGNLRKRRRMCGYKDNCDKDVWFDNVEKMNVTGNRILYGKRRAFDINNHHVKDVMKRAKKYSTINK